MTTPIEVSEEAGVRYLHFGSSWIRGAMRLGRPWALELGYTRDMMVSLLLFNDFSPKSSRRGSGRPFAASDFSPKSSRRGSGRPFAASSKWPRKVLIIGVGAASIPKFLHRHCPNAQLRVVEIDARVV